MDVELVESNAISPVQLEAWWQLFDTVPDAQFYHHPHWHQAIAIHLLAGQLTLGFLTVSDHLQMVLPFCSTAGDRHRAHPQHDHISLNDLLIHPSLANNANQLLKAIRLTLDKPGTNWWDWRVSNLADHGALTQTLTKALLSKTDADSVSNDQNTTQVNISDNWHFIKTRESASFNCTGDDRAPTGKLRRNLRRLRKQLRERGELRVDIATKPEQLTDAYKHFLATEASGWKGTGDQAPAISANPELRAFYHALLKPSIAGIEPQINLLWCGDCCIAAQFGIRTGSCLSLLKIGYNEDYARYSPGYLLLESILDKSPEQGIKTLSLVTSPPWAERWHPDTEPVWQLNHYNNSPIGTALHKLDDLKQVVKSRLKQAA